MCSSNASLMGERSGQKSVLRKVCLDQYFPFFILPLTSVIPYAVGNGSQGKVRPISKELETQMKSYLEVVLLGQPSQSFLL